MIGTILLVVLSTLLVILYKRLTKDANYWKDREVPHKKPLPFFGNMLNFVLKRESIGEVISNIATTYEKEKIIGAYNFTSPIVIVNDIDYAETVLIKEFSSFMDRGPKRKMTELRPLDKHLFLLSGIEWKAVRSKLSPAFTTIRLNGMIPQINQILYDNTFKYIEQHSYDSIDLMSVVEEFTMNIRAGCIFGMDTSKLKNSEFFTRVKEVSNFTFFDFVSLTISLWFPLLATKLDLSVLRKHEDYFVSLLLDEFKKRSSSGANAKKNDFVETLFELKKSGTIKTLQWFQEDDEIKEDVAAAGTAEVDIDDDVLVSASFIFLLAGLDTLRSTSSMTIIELCKNEQILEKLIVEINTVMKKYDGQLSYNALKEMVYLDNCIKETLRLYPAAEFLNRSCVKEYTFDNGFTCHPGDRIFIPTNKFQLDPNLFDEPLKFNPDRFESSMRKGSYAPFGDGPRKCIAQKFAMMEMKIFLSQLLYNFDISLDPKTELPVKVDKWFFLRRPITPVYVKFNKRKN